LKIDTINLLGAATQGELTTVSRHLWQWEGGGLGVAAAAAAAYWRRLL